MLEIKSLVKSFKQDLIEEVRIFDGLNLTINRGDFITIIGSNGAGKSTLLNLIAGNLPVDDGQILYLGKDISFVPNYKRSLFTSYVHQDPSKGVAPNMTLLENLSMAWNKNNPNPFSRGVRKKEISFFKEQLAVCDLGLEEMMDQKVKLLSGGQRQAVSLIMAILHKPSILLLDEHTAALDPQTAHKILSITDQIVKEHRVTTLMVTHNMQDALTLGNRLLMLDHGKVILDLGKEEKVQYTPQMLIEQFKRIKKDALEDRLVLV